MMLLSQISANINPETGIAYGAINGNNLDGEVFNDIYTQVEDKIYSMNDNGLCNMEHVEIHEPEGEFEYKLDKELDGSDEKIKGVLTWLGGAPLLLITWSPWTRSVSPCSPCVPNAGDLDSGDVSSENGVECYSLPSSLMAEY